MESERGCSFWGLCLMESSRLVMPTTRWLSEGWGGRGAKGTSVNIHTFYRSLVCSQLHECLVRFGFCIDDDYTKEGELSTTNKPFRAGLRTRQPGDERAWVQGQEQGSLSMGTRSSLRGRSLVWRRGTRVSQYHIVRQGTGQNQC